MKTMNLIFLLLLTLLLGGSIVYFTAYQPLKKDYDRKVRDLNYYNSTYLVKQGGTMMIPNANSYYLISLDSGKNWYAVDNEKRFNNKEIIILGTADSIYPNLLKHINGMDALTKYVEKNGTIGSKPINQEDIKMLENAGFEVVKK